MEPIYSMANHQWQLSIGLAEIVGLRPFETWNCKPEGCALRAKGAKGIDTAGPQIALRTH